MKLQVYNTDKGLVAVSDHEIKSKHARLFLNNNSIYYADKDINGIHPDSKTIIATCDIHNNGFKLEGCAKFELELLWLAKKQKGCSKTECETIDEQFKYILGFTDGYKANPNKYSEEDLRKAVSDAIALTWAHQEIRYVADRHLMPNKVEDLQKDYLPVIIEQFNKPNQLIAIEVEETYCNPDSCLSKDCTAKCMHPTTRIINGYLQIKEYIYANNNN